MGIGTSPPLFGKCARLPGSDGGELIKQAKRKKIADCSTPLIFLSRTRFVQEQVLTVDKTCLLLFVPKVKNYLGIGWACLFLGTGFGVGKCSSKVTETPRPKTEPEQSRRSAARPSRGEVSQTLRDQIRTAPPSRIANLGSQALQTGDPVARARILSDLQERMDAENFEDVIAAVEKMAAESSRDLRTELKALHLRAGQIGGEAAMVAWEDRFGSGDALATLLGGDD